MPKSTIFRLLAVVFVSLSMLGGGQVAAQSVAPVTLTLDCSGLATVTVLAPETFGDWGPNGHIWLGTPDDPYAGADTFSPTRLTYVPGQAVYTYQFDPSDLPTDTPVVAGFLVTLRGDVWSSPIVCSETPGNGDGDTVENSFTLIAAQRMCGDQTFHATWNGSNIADIEFALSNTSDNWTSGWLAANPSAGAYSSPVDHHAYDKAVVRVTFADGTTLQEEAETNNCVESIPPIPEVPVVVTPGGTGNPAGVPGSEGVAHSPATSDAGTSVTALPKTGVGASTTLNPLWVTVASVALLAGAALTSRRRYA